jgi:hypothetical protein
LAAGPAPHRYLLIDLKPQLAELADQGHAEKAYTTIPMPNGGRVGSELQPAGSGRLLSIQSSFTTKKIARVAG